MRITETHFTVADYCAAIDRREIVVNRDYQRSNKVWPPAARSFLIESILLGYPVPKFLLHQKVDLRTRSAFKEIVDGQQRTSAIKDFFDGKLRLSKSLETSDVAGRVYAELPDEMQGAFLNYEISSDLLVNATDDEVRETFRRMNSYTVPLNPEEQRHATFQGEFKWFVYRVTRELDSPFVRMGTFRDSHIVRMADAKLVSEVVHALIYGIHTTRKTDLDRLYKDFDEQFADAEVIQEWLVEAVDALTVWSEIHNTPLVKPYSAYALILAAIHARHAVGPLVPALRPGVTDAGGAGIVSNAVERLSVLADALEQPDLHRGTSLGKLIAASEKSTNVKEQRITRFNWYLSALTGHGMSS